MNWEKFKALTLKQQITAIWRFYRWHIVTAAILLSIGVFWLQEDVLGPKPMLTVEMINVGAQSADAEAFDPFLKEVGCEGQADAVVVHKNIHTTTEAALFPDGGAKLLFCTVKAGKTDLFFWDAPRIQAGLAGGALMDLREVLPPELLAQYRDYLLYAIDADTEQAYPCGIYLEDNPWIRENSYYDSCAVGIAHSSRDLDLVIRFLTYLLKF